MTAHFQNIRPNSLGDLPRIHPSAFVDPSAQIIGNVDIGQGVLVGPLAVIRADETGPDGRVQPIQIASDSNIQDGVIIHSLGGTSVLIGQKVSVAHGVIIHGPCEIGNECFLALRSVFYNATLEEAVWVGIGSIIMRATIPAGTMVPAGSIIRSKTDVRHFRLVNEKEQSYREDVLEASHKVRRGYAELYQGDKPGA